jgi:hypothetical protein
VLGVWPGNGKAAAELRARQVPMVFSTGYARDALPAAFQDLPCLRKPFSASQLEAAAWAAFVERRGQAGPG